MVNKKQNPTLNFISFGKNLVFKFCSDFPVYGLAWHWSMPSLLKVGFKLPVGRDRTGGLIDTSRKNKVPWFYLRTLKRCTCYGHSFKNLWTLKNLRKMYWKCLVSFRSGGNVTELSKKTSSSFKCHHFRKTLGIFKICSLIFLVFMYLSIDVQLQTLRSEIVDVWASKF